MSPADLLSYLSLPIVCTGLVVLFLCSYLFYLWWDSRVFDATLPPFKVGVAQDKDTDLSEGVRKASHGFVRELITLLGRRLRRRVQFVEMPQTDLEQALCDKKVEIMVLGGDTELVNDAAVEALPCYTTSVDSLSLLFWDKMPNQISSLHDYAYYSSNKTVVLKDSFEDHYMSTFDGIAMHRADTLSNFIVELKTGLVRSGLVRSEYAQCLREEYPNLKVMPVALQKRCIVQDERLCVERGNHPLVLQIDHKLAQMHKDKTVSRLRKKWFA